MVHHANCCTFHVLLSLGILYHDNCVTGQSLGSELASGKLFWATFLSLSSPRISVSPS